MLESFPPALAHGELQQIFPDVYFVTGALRMPMALPVVISRNMVIVVDNQTLTLVNSVRLDDAGLAALDKLGRVKHVIRLAGGHGRDDAFYKARYDAKVWAVAGQIYQRGIGSGALTGFVADAAMDETTELPLAAKLIRIKSAQTPEAVLLLERHGGIVVAGDCFQNWGASDRFFNFAARLMMPPMGFIKPHNIGPAWYKHVKPDIEEIAALLALPFSHLLPAHGTPVIGDAPKAYQPAVERLRGAAARA